MDFELEMLSAEVREGAKLIDTFADSEWARHAARNLADWMARKGIPGSARVVYNGEIVETVVAGREYGDPDDPPPPQVEPLAIADLLGEARGALADQYRAWRTHRTSAST